MDETAVPTPKLADEPDAASADLAQALFESQRFAAQLAISRDALADELATVETRLRGEAARLVEAAHEARDRAFADCHEARAERDQAREAQRAAEANLARVTASTSWRLTAPLRHGLAALLGRPRGKL